METLAFIRCGSRSGTGSRFVLGGILALLVILGMLAMHGVHLGGGSTSQSSTTHVLAPHGATVAVGVASGVDAGAAALLCANCSSYEMSMAANCIAAVVIGFLLLLPGMRQGRLWLLLRAGPMRRVMGLPLPRTPSLNVLCINRS